MSAGLSWHQQRGAGMHALPYDVIGYQFKAEVFCSDHIIEALPTNEGEAFDGWALGEGVTVSTEDNLDEVAAAFQINRDDESTFDSDEFPKVILRDQAGEVECALCCTCADQDPWRKAVHFEHCPRYGVNR